jgi:hypothetical protein
MWGWKEAEFSQADRKELENIGKPLLEGKRRASTGVTLAR